MHIYESIVDARPTGNITERPARNAQPALYAPAPPHPSTPPFSHSASDIDTNYAGNVDADARRHLALSYRSRGAAALKGLSETLALIGAQ